MSDKKSKLKEADELFNQATADAHRAWLMKRVNINDDTDKSMRETAKRELEITRQIEDRHGVPQAWDRVRKDGKSQTRDEAVIKQFRADTEKQQKRGPFVLEVGSSRCGSQTYFAERDKIRANQKARLEEAQDEYLKTHMPAQDALIECRKKIEWAHSRLETPEARERISQEAIKEMKKTLRK